MSVVGDFTEDEIESCILDYLGTVRVTENAASVHGAHPITFRTSASDLHFQQVQSISTLYWFVLYFLFVFLTYDRCILLNIDVFFKRFTPESMLLCHRS